MWNIYSQYLLKKQQKCGQIGYPERHCSYRNEVIGYLLRGICAVIFLYLLLNAGFLRALQLETQGIVDSGMGNIHLFTDGEISPYSELLLISKEEILTDAKIMLPVWYTLPGIAWLMSLLKGSQRPQKQKPQKQATQKRVIASSEVDNSKGFTSVSSPGSASSRKEELKNAARSAEKHYVPEGSTLERELSSYEHTWNRMLDKQAKANLTEDVNSLIRDYTRKVLKTLRASNFTPERISNLADTLVKTPGMQKIHDQVELQMYVQLYMVKLIKGL